MTAHPLELRAVRKEYQNFTLGPIDLAVPRGQVMGLVGANGAGKTTAIKIALGAIKADGGAVHLLDKAKVGVVLDAPSWYSRWRMKDLGSLLGRFYPVWDEQVFNELRAWAGAEPDQRVRELSRGQGMKMQLATALAHRAELLVLDEPTSGLDPVARSELLDQLADFMTDENHAVLFSSHITSDLERIADAVTVLDGGRVIAFGMRDELLESWALLRGHAADLTPELETRVRGIRRHSVGWEALLPATEIGLCSAGIVAETPTIEELVIHLKGTSHA